MIFVYLACMTAFNTSPTNNQLINQLIWLKKKKKKVSLVMPEVGHIATFPGVKKTPSAPMVFLLFFIFKINSFCPVLN